MQIAAPHIMHTNDVQCTYIYFTVPHKTNSETYQILPLFILTAHPQQGKSSSNGIVVATENHVVNP